MALAESSQTRLAFVPEVTAGTTPTSPSFVNFRMTGEGLQYNKQVVTSNEIRADRNVSESIDNGYGVSGNVDFELSYGLLDVLLESVFQSTWNTNVLKNGATPKSFTAERTVECGTTDQFFRYTGLQAGSLSLAIAARSIITGSINFLGMGHTAAAAALSGATYTAVGTQRIMEASGDVGSLTVTGASPAPTLMSLNLNIENNLRERLAIGSRGPIGIGSGRFVVTGSLEAYFEDRALYDAFLDHDDIGIAATLGHTTAEKYTLNVPKTKLSNGRVTAAGNDQDIMAAFDFAAEYDGSGSPAFAAAMSLTRAVA